MRATASHSREPCCISVQMKSYPALAMAQCLTESVEPKNVRPVTFSPRIIFSFDGVPDTGVRRGIEGRSVFPGCWIDHSLVDATGKRLSDRAAIFAGWRRERELKLARIGVIRVRIGIGWRRLRSVLRGPLRRALRLGRGRILYRPNAAATASLPQTAL